MMYCPEALSKMDRKVFPIALIQFVNEIENLGMHCPDPLSSNLFIAFERLSPEEVVVVGLMKMRDGTKAWLVDVVLVSPRLISETAGFVYETVLNGLLDFLYSSYGAEGENQKKRFLVRMGQEQTDLMTSWILDNPNFVRAAKIPYVLYQPERASGIIMLFRERNSFLSNCLGEMSSDSSPPPSEG